MSDNLSDFLKNYQKKQMLRLHMPGHKGAALPHMDALSPAYALDITEIAGADSLFEADGILRQAEQRTAALYHAGATCWSAGGATLCIQAMLARMKAEGRTVIAARTVHRAFLNSCILLDLPVKWVFPINRHLIGGKYRTEDFARALEATSEPACVYVTSPDYHGNQQDIAALAAICRERHARLLVDNAHGTHLAFTQENRHPLALGAAFCCDSAHKTLPALTGGAFLHMRHPEDYQDMKQHMQMFGSTSPSYLILHSLESCTQWLAAEGRERIIACEQRVRLLKSHMRDYFDTETLFLGEDCMHLTLHVNGLAMAEILRMQYGIECEYADSTCLVLLLSPVMPEQAFCRLEAALQNCKWIPAETPPELPPPPEQVCDMRTAALSPWESVPLEQATGRICASVQVACPPAVPMLVSGERVSREWQAYMEFFGLHRIAVMK